LLTLVALPYIRYKYGAQFSILKLNSVILLLHLSLCDLLYGIIGFPHLIHTYLYMTNVYSDDVCYLLGMVRNLIAYTDFTNIAVISCCVARQTLCKLCDGSIVNHDKHDKIFGGRRIYLVCIGTWVVSLLVLLPDIRGETGCYAWSNDAYGCYNINDTNECSNIGPFFNLIINFCTVVCFYSVITFKMLRYRFKSNNSEVYDENMKSISMTMLILTIAYLAFLLPVLIFETCSPAGSFFPSKKKRMIIASWYWWLYGVNFLIYLVSSQRIRDAYKKFLQDVFSLLRWKIMEYSGDDNTTTCWGANISKIKDENTLNTLSLQEL